MSSSSHLVTDKTLIVRWSRDELEDKYLRLCEDYMQVKIQLNDKDEIVKKQQAQLVKFRKGQGEHSVSPNRDDSVLPLQARVLELEKQNMLLKDKNSSRSLRPKPSPVDRPEQISPSGHSLVPVTVVEQKNLEVISSLREKVLSLETNNFHFQEQIRVYELEIASLKDELRRKQTDFVSEYDRLKLQITTEQRFTVQENIEIIRFQKLLREKSNDMALLQTRFNKLEMDMRTLKSNYDIAILELDQANMKIRTEQTVNSQIQNEIRLLQSDNSGNALQMRQEVETLKRENEILEDANKKLTASAFNTEREKQWEITEKTLRSQIAQLETTVKTDVNIRGELLEKLAIELTSKDELEQQVRKYEVTSLQQKAELERLQEKLDKITVGQNVQYEELVEVLTIIRQRKQVTYVDGPIRVPNGLLPIAQPSPDFEEQRHQLELSYAETVQELEKTRNMLLIQHKINRDYQLEVEEVTKRAEQNKSDYEKKIKEYAEMLDQRALRIQRLEKQLHDIAYGTRPYKTVPGETPSDKDFALEAGQNILELHITKVNFKVKLLCKRNLRMQINQPKNAHELILTDQGLRFMQSVEPSTFLTIEFFDFEIQFTPMLRGAGPETDFTCQYTVTVTDLFLHYLQTDTLVMELHQAIATHYKTWAAGHVDLKDLINKPQGKIVGSVHLLGVSAESVGITFGQVEFSLQLKVPVEQALRLYKERTKALGYVLANRETTQETFVAEQTQQITNQLHIYIHRCHNLKSKIPGTVPSTFAVYQFFEFPDHDTKTVQDNANPEFSDHMTYPIVMDRSADQFLRSQSLRIYVIDDSAPNDDLSYLGHVDIPLIPLAHNKPIVGSFELRTTGENVAGTLDVSLNWQFAYIAAPDVMFITEPMVTLPPAEDLQQLPPKPPTTKDDLDETPVLVKAKRKVDEILRQPALVVPNPDDLVVGHSSGEEQTVVRIDKVVTPNDQPVRESRLPRPSSGIIGKPAIGPSVVESPATGEKPTDARPFFEPEKIDAESSEEEKSATLVVPPDDKKIDEYGIRRTEEPVPKLPPPAAPRKLKPLVSPPEEDKSKPSKEVVRGKVSDEEDAVVSEPKTIKVGKVPAIKIGVNSLWLPEDSPLLTDENVSKIFVEWHFLDLQPEESETPESLPKPSVAGHRVNYNCLRQVEMNPNRESLLKEMIINDDPIVFEVISDPGDSGECDELGRTTVSLKDIIQSDRNLDNVMFDVVNEDNKVIAILHITVHILDTIKQLQKIA